MLFILLSYQSLICTLQAEETRLQELDDMANNAAFQLNGRLSHSDLSSASMDRYMPRKSADKESLSMKSDCGMGFQRRVSIVNSTGRKVR